MKREKDRYKDNSANELRRQIATFQTILGKENCPVAEEKLKKEFFGSNNHNETRVIPGLQIMAHFVMDELKMRHVKKVYSNNPDKKKLHKKLHKKLVSLRNSLRTVYQLMCDPDICNYYVNQAHTDPEVSAHTILKSHGEFLHQVRVRDIQLDMLLHEETKQGRPSLESFYKFVFKVAQIYEEISEQHFKIDRHKADSGEEAGKYVLLTAGHRFVYEAVQWMHEWSETGLKYEVRYTDKNIYNACEKAQKLLNEKRASPINSD